MYKIESYDGSLEEYKSILGALTKNRLLNIKKEEGSYRLTDAVDDYYSILLTKDQFLALIKELKVLSK